MASVALDYPRTGIWRSSRRDAVLVALAALHPIVLIIWPLAPLIAIGVWWNSNTIAHNFIHRPFFRSPGMNRLFSAALSVLLGIPQTLWRDRHLAHHAGVEWRLRVSRQLVVETALVLTLWTALAALEPHFFLLVYLPGYFAGLALCALQGHWEHAVGTPTSHYGRIYNFLCFNDGYHAEHHANPSTHWTNLRVQPSVATSRWPPLLRWLDDRKSYPVTPQCANGGLARISPLLRNFAPVPYLPRPESYCLKSTTHNISPLESLERLVLRSPRLQRTVLRSHRRAFQLLLPQLKNLRSVTIVGGGLFPRTALILTDLLPLAHLTILDSNPRNLDIARRLLGETVEYRLHHFVPGESQDCDLLVIPLCLRGDRRRIYSLPPSPSVLVHDWIWRRRGTGAVVSIALLKRLNLVRQ